MFVASRAIFVLLALWSAHAEQATRPSADTQVTTAPQPARSRKPSAPLAGMSAPIAQHQSSLQGALRDICITKEQCTELIYDIIEARYEKSRPEYDLYSLFEFQICANGRLRRVLITHDNDRVTAEIDEKHIHIRVPLEQIRVARTLEPGIKPTVEIKRVHINLPPAFIILVEADQILYRRDPRAPDGTPCHDEPVLGAYLDLVVSYTAWHPDQEKIEYTRIRMDNDSAFADKIRRLIEQLAEVTEERTVIDHIRRGTTAGQALYQHLQHNGDFVHGFNQWVTEQEAQYPHGGPHS